MEESVGNNTGKTKFRERNGYSDLQGWDGTQDREDDTQISFRQINLYHGHVLAEQEGAKHTKLKDMTL